MGRHRNFAAALLLVACLAHGQQTAERAYAEGQQLARAAGTRRQAVELLRTAADLYRREGSMPGVAKSLLLLGRTQETLRELDAAEQNLREVVRMAADSETVAGAWHGIGNIQMARGVAVDALESYRKALELRRRTGDRFQEAILLNNIAASHWSSGDAALALEEYRQVLEIRKSIDDRVGLAYAMYGMALCHYSMGAYQEALETYREMLPIWRQTKNAAGEANTLNSMGLLLAGIGDRAAARRQYDQALALWRSAGNPAGEAYTVSNLGLLDSAEANETQAIGKFERALAALRAAGDKRGEAYALHNLGNSFGNIGENGKAISFYKQALELKRSIGDRFGEAYTLHNLGESYRGMKRIPQAREQFEQALAIRESIADRTGQMHSLAGLAWCARAMNEPDEAHRLSLRALQFVEEQRGQLLNQDLRITWFAGNRGVHDFAVELLASMGRHREAFELSERARARSLLDALAESIVQIREGVPADILERERRARRALAARAERMQRLFSTTHSASDAVLARRQFDVALGALAEAQDRVRAASPAYANLVHPEPAGLDAVRNMLAGDTALIEFYTAENRSFAWRLTRDSLDFRELPSRKALDSLVRRWLGALTARNAEVEETLEQRQARVARADTEAAALAALLRRQLFGDWIDNRRRIVLVPDGPLHYVPFPALLPSRVEVTRAPSASAIAAMRLRQGQPSRNLALVADAVYQVDDPRVKAAGKPRLLPEYARLRFSRVEAERIAALDSRPGNLLALDFAARKSLLGTLGAFRFIHLATHAFVDPERPALSGIVLSRLQPDGSAGDGYVRLHEIYNLELNADLVVLSACQTALGKEFAGEGLAALTRGFLYAGARRVVASLWNVQDRATAEFMRRFYAGLLQRRLSPPAALRAARSQMAGDERWRSPYFWAGFELVGDWR